MTTKELYTKGARIWIPNPETVWEGAEVTENFKSGVLVIRVDESGDSRTLVVKTDTDLPPLRNPPILIGENDLTSLSYLHEPAVLHNLKVRFCDLNAIYTYCGIVLVAINPYDELPIYGEDTILAYRGQAMGDLDPHIFAVAEEAYTKLERERRDQSIIVSGESGAGKTVSAKYAMRYFATVGGSTTETQVEKKVLASSPIMEAIGNAKTTRNDNSSRFGKFIEIHFSKAFHIVGASMRTYLLEKSRVVFQAPGERNYHIFYQLCAVRNTMPELKLDHQDTFNFLNQGDNPIIDGVDDAKGFAETKQALTTLGFTSQEQADMFKIWAAILHLGNVNITELKSEEMSGGDDGEASFISPKDKHLSAFCMLAGSPPEATIHRLTHRKIVSRSETIESPLRHTQAHAARDALAKRLYAELFSWLVTGANRALRCTQPTAHFIGVLDIYGFETFETNSFEQFCINYANEKLQQQFNSHVFKLEQEEYLREEITWTMIHFSDNQPCIDLIEARLGVLDLLDEECRMPQGSDASWLAKMHERCKASAHFVKPRFNTNAFVIKHFADDVIYQTTGFLEKNRDTVLEEQIDLLKQHAASSLLRQLCGSQQQSTDTLGVPEPKPRVKISPAKPSAPSASTKQNRQSVGAQFRNSLTALMATLNATTPHYVRCIKPNDDKGAFQYDPARAVQQLRACGVLETIRISAAGFPSRWLYQDFFIRYRVLCNTKDINRNDSRTTCSKIIEKCIKDEDKYRFGKAKLFFRAGQVAYLEKLRAERLRRCCIIMQSQIRAFVCRKKYLKIKTAIAGLQRYGRGFLARKLAQELRRQRAATILQKRIRGWLARLRYKRIKATVLGLQRYARGYLARRAFMKMKYNAAAIKIQTRVRGWLARKRYAKMMYRVVICQSAIRRFLARRQYRKLRAEARSVEHVKKLNRGLENKIISLQQKLGNVQVDNKQIAHLVNEVSDLKVKLEPLKGLEAELKELKLALRDREAKIVTLDQQLTQERDNSIELVEEKNKLNEEYIKQKEIWTYESSKMAKELMSLKETNIVSQKDSEKKMKEQYELEKRELLSELDLEKTAYQRLLTEQYQLQARLEEMQGRRSLRGHQRSLSNASTASQPENAAEDDIGYGSTRSTTSSSTIRAGLETIDWQKNSAPSENADLTTRPATDQSGDPGLIIRLQRRAKRAEEERARLARRVERLESARATQPQAHAAEDQHRINDLEIECTRLTNDLNRLRASVARADGADVSSRELAEQFSAQQEELERRREECIQLRSVLANQTVNLKSLATSNYGSDVDVINEDGELVQAFEAQKKITRQLEDELLADKEHFKETLADYKADLEKLREDNDKQQKLLTANLTSDPQTQMEQFIHYEVTRLTSENLNLQDKNDHLSVNVDKYKTQVALLMKKLKELGYQDFSQLSPKTENAIQESQNVPKEKESSMVPVVRKREREDYLGMFEYKSGMEPIIVQRLVSELSPRTAVTLLPGLPAYVVFMCIRHTDHINDDEKVRGILTTFINTVKRVIKKKGDKVDTAVLWMANALRLLHCLKQYSGDASYQFNNTAIQNEQCLRNFDLSEYRQLLSDVAVWIYQALIGIVERRIQALIVPALLEYEEICGVSGGAPRGRAQSVAEGVPSTPAEIRSPANLCAEFAQIKKSLDFFGVDPDLAVQIFRQLYFYVCASCLNQLLLRKDLCHWLKGVQVRYNISYLETWFKENCANYNQEQVKGVQATLKPIIQAVCLLQARKSSADVQSTCDMCPDLTPMQICKILNLYTPTEDFEPKITVEFIRQIQACLQERNKDKPHGQQANLLMDTKYQFPVKFPFNPSAIRLEDIELPKALNLEDLLTKV